MKSTYTLTALVFIFGVVNGGWAADQDGIHNKGRLSGSGDVVGTDWNGRMIDIETTDDGEIIDGGTLRIPVANGDELVHDFATDNVRLDFKSNYPNCSFTVKVRARDSGIPYVVSGYYVYGVSGNRTDDCVILSWYSTECKNKKLRCKKGCVQYWGGGGQCCCKPVLICEPEDTNPCDAGDDMLTDTTPPT